MKMPNTKYDGSYIIGGPGSNASIENIIVVCILKVLKEAAM